MFKRRQKTVHKKNEQGNQKIDKSIEINTREKKRQIHQSAVESVPPKKTTVPINVENNVKPKKNRAHEIEKKHQLNRTIITITRTTVTKQKNTQQSNKNNKKNNNKIRLNPKKN